MNSEFGAMVEWLRHTCKAPKGFKQRQTFKKIFQREFQVPWFLQMATVELTRSLGDVSTDSEQFLQKYFRNSLLDMVK